MWRILCEHGSGPARRAALCALLGALLALGGARAARVAETTESDDDTVLDYEHEKGWAREPPALAPGNDRYLFFRSMAPAGGAGAAGESGRRLFGGRAVPPASWGAACVLLDDKGAAQCSGAVLARRWAVTAAHCVTAAARRVRYGSALAAAEGGLAAVAARYRHPNYTVRLQDEGSGLDVVALQHDVGLLQTHDDMLLPAVPRHAPLQALRFHTPGELVGAEIEVLGYGRTEESGGVRLRGAVLVGAVCERAAWRGCVCARARAAGVCAGDSGGPALRRGRLVAVASLGPARCAEPSKDDPVASSVLTPLQPYAGMIDNTLAGLPGGFDPHGAPSALRNAACSLPCAAPPLLPLLLTPLLTPLLLRGLATAAGWRRRRVPR